VSHHLSQDSGTVHLGVILVMHRVQFSPGGFELLFDLFGNSGKLGFVEVPDRILHVFHPPMDLVMWLIVVGNTPRMAFVYVVVFSGFVMLPPTTCFELVFESFDHATCATRTVFVAVLRVPAQQINAFLQLLSKTLVTPLRAPPLLFSTSVAFELFGQPVRTDFSIGNLCFVCDHGRLTFHDFGVFTGLIES
jgi:hypothetical protein